MKKLLLIFASAFVVFCLFGQDFFYANRIGIHTNDPIYALQIFQPDNSLAAIDITYAAGAGNTTALQIHNGTGQTNAYIGVGGNAYFAGSIQLGVSTPITPAMFYITNNSSGPLMRLDSIHGASLFNILTNGNVGIGTNDPKAVMHFFSPVTANPKLMQFDDDGHVPRAFAGIFPGGGGFSFFNGAGTNDNARTIGWTATSTIMNAPTTAEIQIAGVAHHRITSTGIAPVANNSRDIGTLTLQYRTQYVAAVRSSNITAVANISAASGTFTGGGTNTFNNISVGVANAATITNILAGSATLNFASQSVGSFEDLPITVTGALDGDIVSIGYDSAVASGIIGSFTGYASNGVVFVRFVSTAATQNPASGTFRALVHKVQF